MFVFAIASRNRLGCFKRQLIFCLFFIGFFNYAANCVAAQKETSKSLDRALKSKDILDRNGAGVGSSLCWGNRNTWGGCTSRTPRIGGLAGSV